MATEKTFSKPDHTCHKEEIIEAIRERLGDGQVSFSSISGRLQNIEQITSEIREQTMRTNGRVTKIEKFIFASRIITLTIVIMILAAKFGIIETILKFL